MLQGRSRSSRARINSFAFALAHADRIVALERMPKIVSVSCGFVLVLFWRLWCEMVIAC